MYHDDEVLEREIVWREVDEYINPSTLSVFRDLHTGDAHPECVIVSGSDIIPENETVWIRCATHNITLTWSEPFVDCTNGEFRMKGGTYYHTV